MSILRLARAENSRHGRGDGINMCAFTLRGKKLVNNVGWQESYLVGEMARCWRFGSSSSGLGRLLALSFYGVMRAKKPIEALCASFSRAAARPTILMVAPNSRARGVA